MRRLPSFLTGLALLTVTSLPVGAAELSGWMSSLEDAKKSATTSGKPILVDLYAEWCGWCKRLERQVYSTPRFKEYASRFVLLRVDVEDRGEGSRLQQRFEAFSLPTTLIVDAELVSVGKVEGFLPVESYIESLEGELARYRELMVRYEKQKGSVDVSTVQSLATELYERSDGRRSAALWARLLDSGKVNPASLGQFHYRLADAWRLAGDLGKAQAAITKAQREAAGRQDFRLAEASDLMAFRITQELGECKRALEAIQAFLKQYPASEYRTFARQSLRDLQAKSTC